MLDLTPGRQGSGSWEGRVCQVERVEGRAQEVRRGGAAHLEESVAGRP